jgi:hypothetical protein
MNRITYNQLKPPTPVRVSSLESGTYAEGVGILAGNIYLVVVNRPNLSAIEAINIENGGYITANSLVIPLPRSAELNLIVNLDAK